MTTAQLQAWQKRLGYTNADAAEALGMSLSGYMQQRLGVHRTRGTPVEIDKRTALACIALEAMQTGRFDVKNLL